MNKVKFRIGHAQTFQQAWSAMLAGHYVRRADWPTNTATYSPSGQMLLTANFRAKEVESTGPCRLAGPDIAAKDWHVMTETVWKPNQFQITKSHHAITSD